MGLQSIYGFLLVISRNNVPILHHVSDITITAHL